MLNLEIEYPKKPSKYSQQEWEARVNLAACYRLTDYYGWTSTVYNHITLRVPDTDTFLINCFGLNYNEICASSKREFDCITSKVVLLLEPLLYSARIPSLAISAAFT